MLGRWAQRLLFTPAPPPRPCPAACCLCSRRHAGLTAAPGATRRHTPRPPHPAAPPLLPGRHHGGGAGRPVSRHPAEQRACARQPVGRRLRRQVSGGESPVGAGNQLLLLLLLVPLAAAAAGNMVLLMLLVLLAAACSPTLPHCHTVAGAVLALQQSASSPPLPPTLRTQVGDWGRQGGENQSEVAGGLLGRAGWLAGWWVQWLHARLPNAPSWLADRAAGAAAAAPAARAAGAMGRVAERWPVDFVVSTGDNIYPR